MMKEKEIRAANGITVLLVFILLIAVGCFGVYLGAGDDNPLVIVGSVFFITVIAVLSAGLFNVEPNQAVALTLFGNYKGTVRQSGLRWANPFYSKNRVSLRVRNFESDKLKVNDSSGSPIEIAAVVVWKVVDSAEALFSVDDYRSFVRTQSEAALRTMATSYPYDHADDDEQLSLRANAGQISDHLKKEIQDRLDDAGIDVIETRISHLAYAPEIASAMLQRQQAAAIIAARQKIVEGAVGMVDMALAQLKQNDIIDLDEERKAAMVSNLLVVLCGDKATQPIVNTGTLYQ